MDFIKDYADIVKEILKLEGFTISNDLNDEEIMSRWSHWNLKQIEPKPRTIHLSSKIQCISLDEKYMNALDKITVALKNGEDVNKYLSKKLLQYDTDFLLCDWNIKHLHLSNEDEVNSRFAERSDKLLFLMHNSTDVYLIDVRDHNEKNVFAKRELIKIVNKEWSYLIDDRKMQGARPVPGFILSDEDIDKLRRVGMVILTELGDDELMVPINFGVTTAGTPVWVREQVDMMNRYLRYRQQYVEENYKDITNVIKLKFPHQVDFDFRIEIYNNRFEVFEMNSLCLIEIPNPWVN